MYSLSTTTAPGTPRLLHKFTLFAGSVAEDRVPSCFLSRGISWILSYCPSSDTIKF